MEGTQNEPVNELGLLLTVPRQPHLQVTPLDNAALEYPASGDGDALPLGANVARQGSDTALATDFIEAFEPFNGTPCFSHGGNLAPVVA